MIEDLKRLIAQKAVLEKLYNDIMSDNEIDEQMKESVTILHSIYLKKYADTLEEYLQAADITGEIN